MENQVKEQQEQQEQQEQTVDAVEICAQVPDEAVPYTKIVGKWVWVTFDKKPTKETRKSLLALGFHWNKKRACWQHSCGVRRKMLRNGDPRDKYRQVALADVLDGKAEI